MKRAIENIIGPRNARQVGQFRKAARISINRFIRTMSGKEEFIPLTQTRTFAFPDSNVFFGHYDVPQFSNDEALLLATAARLMNTTPSPNDQLRIGYYDLREEKPEFREFGSTETWCWQQGCRLQWYSSDEGNCVIYNALVEKRHGSLIQDIQTGRVVRALTRPVYSVSPNGKWALSLDFGWLQRLRPGYGYQYMGREHFETILPEENGIWRIDVETGEDRMLFCIRDIAKIGRNGMEDVEQQYFNHLLFNPSGKRFMFFHLRRLPTGRTYGRLMTADTEGSDIRLLNESGHVSHYCWKDDDQLLCYCTFTGKGEGYFLYDEHKGEVQCVGAEILMEDGHPSYLASGDYLVTDRYRDRFGERSLLLYDCKSERLKLVHKEFSPVKFDSETRCDLHPRVSLSGKYICIDCVEDGKRAMKVIDISSLI